VIGGVTQVRRFTSDERNILHNLRLEKSGILGKTIVFAEKRDFRKPDYITKKWKYKFRKPHNNYLYRGEIAIFGEYVSLISYRDKPYGFLVKSEDISSVAREMFNLAWR